MYNVKRKKHQVEEHEINGVFDTILASSAVAGRGRKKLTSRLTIDENGAFELLFVVYHGNDWVFSCPTLIPAITAYNSIDETVKAE